MNSALAEFLVEQRLRAYPSYLLKLGYYLDGQPLVLYFYEIQKRFFEYLDLNYYFFANHPNSRVGVTEVEKFPYILIPFFIYGLYKLFDQKNYLYFISFFVLILCLSIKYENLADPILVYPFIIYAIYKSFTKK